MSGAVYYNEIDAEKAAWIRELVKRGIVAPGEVDERSIADVDLADLRGFTQCHFFAGIAVWSYALRLAGWPDDKPCWTGSCPCPSFSCAGKGTGFDDPRHLWPEFYRLIGERRPATVFGEQSADAIGHGWWDLVSTDLESSAYAVAAAVLSSAGVGGSDKRHRLYFVGLADTERERERAGLCDRESRTVGRLQSANSGVAGRMAHTASVRLSRSNRASVEECGPGTASTTGGLANSQVRQRGREQISIWEARGAHPESDRSSGSMPHPFADALKGYWQDADWLFCTDGRWRPVEAGTFPLADGSAFRLGRLRGYGDCINAEVAKAFIAASVE